MKFLNDILTETDNRTLCPIRVSGLVICGVLVFYAVYGIVHKTGDSFQDIGKGFAWFIGTWAGAIGGKSKLGGDANAASGPSAHS